MYFWAYEKLMQREMATKRIARDQVNPAKAVLFGAAAGYVVRVSPSAAGVCPGCRHTDAALALGGDIPHRHDQVPHTDRRVLTRGRPKVHVDARLRAESVAGRGCGRVRSRSDPDFDQVCLMPR